ncbi:RNA-directed DNA polymerase [Flavobacterium sp.]|uniref:RNA-directed DNA polymerase n=1 Tax=Flavobacterium sp. TaxID=239 RepID=UPI0025D44A01|nr:RNA-directed DNA polymerase [Flavobacterium sp.]
MRRILELNNTEARAYFLKTESYFNFDLPQYFVFQNIINQVSAQLTGRRLSDFLGTFTTPAGQVKSTYPSDFENVNYSFLNNKDGKFAWRPFQLIHPALYVSLVHNMTEEANWNLIKARFTQFDANPKIKCYSIPLESEDVQSDKATTVTQWWQTIEQHSIELALKYEYVLHTDITDCYGSIYTHSVSWAIHTKPFAKLLANRNNHTLIGNSIDKHLREMAFGQTNGIPQGSVVMDFIAEIVLGFADLELTNRIPAHVQDYQIIRYRDDYRIFSNNPQDAELITKILTEILIELGMRLNASKTIVSNNVVRDSIKPDKLYWISQKNGSKSIQEHLLIIHNLSEKHPNSGSLSKALGKFYDRIKGLAELHHVPVLISILVDIMYKNPRTYPIASAILSKLFSILNDASKREAILESIMAKFEKIPNTGHIKIWLQRLTIKIDRAKVYEENLCRKVNDQTIQIWDSSWLNARFKTLIDNTPIIDEQVIQNIDVVINPFEVQLFIAEYDEDPGD